MVTSAAAAAAPGSCQAVSMPPRVGPDGWLLLAALVVYVAGRWSR
ncbi:hypothetical protein [Massilia phyllostachyos]|nr:hypothetical protein [Massilia phyllostachyos]